MWWMRLLTGCSDNHFSYARPIETCESTHWPEEDVDPSASPLWDMRDLWVADLGGSTPDQFEVAPFEDTNGDGVIGEGDRLDVVVSTIKLEELTFINQVWYVDGATGEQTQLLSASSSRQLTLAIAEVDPLHPGPEIVIAQGSHISIADREGVYLEAEVPDLDTWRSLRVADLDQDGLGELVTTTGVFDLATATPRFLFDRPQEIPPVAADLDGDGMLELIVGSAGGLPLVLDASGQTIGSCAHPDWVANGYTSWTFAVAELDGDTDLEVLVSGSAGMAVCDRDGTVLASNDKHMYYGTVSIAQLDTDPEPEIVAGAGELILVFEHDLSERSGLPLFGGGYGFSAADLDGDGFHEVISWQDTALLVSGPTGTPYAYQELEGVAVAMAPSAATHPAAADLDGDGRAELLVSEFGSGGIRALDNEVGGWSVLGGQLPWSGADYHPDATRPDGSPGRISPEGVALGHNVWNARPAVPPQCSQAVSLDVRDVCVESCRGDGHVTVYVRNAGVLPVASSVSVEVWAEGERLASVPMPLVPSETAVPVQLTVPAASLRGEIEARLAGPLETGCQVPTASWDEPVCTE